MRLVTVRLALSDRHGHFTLHILNQKQANPRFPQPSFRLASCVFSSRRTSVDQPAAARQLISDM